MRKDQLTLVQVSFDSWRNVVSRFISHWIVLCKFGYIKRSNAHTRHANHKNNQRHIPCAQRDELHVSDSITRTTRPAHIKKVTQTTHTQIVEWADVQKFNKRFFSVQFGIGPFFSQANRLFVFDVFFSQSSSVSPRFFVTTSCCSVLSETSTFRVFSSFYLQYGRSIEDHFQYQLRHKRSDFLSDHRNKLRIISNWLSRLILWHLWHFDILKFISDRKSESDHLISRDLFWEDLNDFIHLINSSLPFVTKRQERVLQSELDGDLIVTNMNFYKQITENLSKWWKEILW